MFWDPSDAFFAGLGVYDGAGQRGVPTGSRGPRTLIGDKLFTIGEAGIRWNAEADLFGRAAVGAWCHNGDFDTISGSTQSGTGGWYGLIEQHLFRENPCNEDGEQGLGVFVQYGQADQDVSEVRRHIGGGFAWRGMLPTRDNDTFGIGVTSVRFSDRGGFRFSSETATEAFYKLKLTKWAGITFDVQHISHPGHPGGVAGRRDALVGTSRFVILF